MVLNGSIADVSAPIKSLVEMVARVLLTQVGNEHGMWVLHVQNGHCLRCAVPG